VALVAAFAPLLLVPSLHAVGQLGVSINALLAAFNMIPFGPLDGRKVRQWSLVVFGVTFAACLGLAFVAFVYVGTGF
jgi:Zn-dependent protease